MVEICSEERFFKSASTKSNISPLALEAAVAIAYPLPRLLGNKIDWT